MKIKNISAPLAIAILLALIVSATMPLAAASKTQDPTVWGMEATFVQAHLVQYCFTTAGCLGTPFGGIIRTVIPQGSNLAPANGRGVAVGTGGLIWYSVLKNVSISVGGCMGLIAFCGDGLIRVVNPNSGSCPVGFGVVCPDAFAVLDPGGFGGPGIGALDIQKGVLWAISYLPVGGWNTIYKMDPFTGKVLASCHVPFLGGGAGVDTLEINPRTGNIVTDQGELLLVLHQYLQPGSGSYGLLCASAGPGTDIPSTVGGLAGIDFGATAIPVFTGTHLYGSTAGSICVDVTLAIPAPVCIGTGGFFIEDISVV